MKTANPMIATAITMMSSATKTVNGDSLGSATMILGQYRNAVRALAIYERLGQPARRRLIVI